MRHWLWLCLLWVSADASARALKGKKDKKDDAVNKLKAAIKKLQDEKQTLSDEVMHSADAAAAKAQKVSELTSQVSEREKTIRDLKAEIAKKNPQCSSDVVASDRTAKLTEEAARQQKEIANLTMQLSALRIKYQLLEEEFGDPSLRFFLAAKATKVYQDPGIQGAANKTFKYVLPHVSEALKTGTEVYSAMNSSVLDGIHTLLGSDTKMEPWLPLVSAFLVYGMICCPIGIVLSYLVEFVCNLREILLACSFYLVCVSCLASIFVAATQRDPLKELAQNDPSVLLLQQMGFAGVLVFYLAMLALATCWAVCDENVPFNVILARLTQASFLIVFSTTYYRLVWTPTMLDELPQVEEVFSRGKSASMLPYVLAMTGFGGNLWLEWKAGAVAKAAAQERDGKDA